MAGPLDGVRIVDLTAMVTGPLATQILGDQGADIVKIEPPGLGDVIRLLGTARSGMSALFATMNRSKRSMVINLKDESGRDLVRRLAADADVFVQNFRPGVIERLGLGEAELRAENPNLIYVSISAYGPEGPYSAKPAFDHILQGLSGMADAQAAPGSEQPEYVRQPVCDKMTAFTVAQGITAALLARERGRGGQHLRVSMLDATLAFLWPDGMTNQTFLEEDVVPLPPIGHMYRVLSTADDYVSVAAVTDAQIEGLFRAMQREDLIGDPRFAGLAERSANIEALFEELAFGDDPPTASEAIARLEAQDVPCGPVLRRDDLADDPHIRAIGSLLESEHPVAGRMRQARPAVHFEATPAAIQGHAPTLGQHTDEVLGERLRLSQGEIADLRAKGVVA
jgi:crotonobetainyl-CoA:carnitine CoA-transferase CaiB-like acyl-CoA transferase